MNSVSKLALFWYMFLTLLAAVSPITIPFVNLLGGLVLLWIVYLFFLLGSTSKVFSYPISESITANTRIKTLPISLVAVVAVGASLFAVKFYTGKTVVEVIISLVLKASLYKDYQQYFADQGLAIFSFTKIPAIISMFLLKLAVIYCFIYVIILSKDPGFKDLLSLVTVSVSQLFFSIARGTSFELFELLLLLWFCLYLRKAVYKINKPLINVQSILFVTVTLLTALLYSWNISARYSFGDVAMCSTADLCLDNQSIIYHISPPVAEFLYKISGYFTFGIFYTSKFMSEFWLAEPKNVFSLFLPFANSYRPDLKPDLLCGANIDCGASWVPDVISYILRFGYFYLLFFVFVLGGITRRLLQLVQLRPRFLEIAILFFIFLCIVSMPVGNFITASSANILGLIVLSAGFFFRKIFQLYCKRVKVAKQG